MKSFDHSIFSFDHKVVIVTGAARGVGFTTGKLFADCGATVVMLDRLPAVSESWKSLSVLTGQAFQCDITDREQVENVVRTVVGNYGRIDVLVNCAGICRTGTAEDLSDEDWLSSIAVNLTGVFYMCRAVGKHMIARGGGGKIVNIASHSALVATKGNAAYTAGKAGVVALTRNLALDWAEHNIQVNAISPTAILTEMALQFSDGDERKLVEKWRTRIPAGRLLYPGEVAEAILFLCSRCADMICGENLVIDGGYSIQ